MTWSANTPEGDVTWSDRLTGDPRAVLAVETELDGFGTIAVTPSGPFVRRDPADELAVLAALSALYPAQLVLSGAPPSLDFDAPEGADF